MMRRFLIGLSLWLFAGTALAGSLAGLTDFTSGTTISSSEMNANFASIETEITDNATDIATLEAASDEVGYSVIMEEGSGLAEQGTVNFIGSGVTCANDVGNARTNCTFTNTTSLGFDAITAGNLTGETIAISTGAELGPLNNGVITANSLQNGTIDQLADFGSGLCGVGFYLARTGSGWVCAAIVTDTILSTEEVEDIVGGMVSGNTETGIAVTYDDGSDKLDFEISGNIDLGTGTIRGAVDMETTSSTTHALSDAEGQWLFADEAGATQINLPALSSGASVCVYSATAQVISLNPDGAESIFLNGATIGAGDELDSPGALGDFACLLSNGTNWYVLGTDGLWVDGGAS